MNFIIYFFIVILGYLTIAKSTNENYFSINTIDELKKLPEANLHPPTTIILVSIKSHGTFIPSHYFRLKLVSAFFSSKIVHVRVTKNLVSKYSSSLGLSIYSVSNQSEELNDTRITIPGMFFVGNPQLGRWVYLSQEERWSFYKAYQHLPSELGWAKFRPKITDYKNYLETSPHTEYNDYPSLFGTSGQLTKKFLLMHISDYKNDDNEMGIHLLRSYFNYK